MAQADQHIAAADEEVDDGRSEVGTLQSSSTSVSSSLLDYRIENGRTYHKYKDGKYTWPNDDREAERLNMQHEIYVYTLGGKLGLAPPCEEETKVGRVLDLGTGTGIWALDFGDLHPESEVLGMDLSHTQPNITLPNVHFEIDDFDEEWTYSRPFDYIHSRAMTSSVADWKTYITKAFDNLAPGGWFEIQEGDVSVFCDDDTFPKDCAFAKMTGYLKEACAKLGRPWADVPSLKDLMVEVGFVDVEMRKYKWPINDWAKAEHYRNLGVWTYDNAMAGLEAMCMAPFTRGLEWTRAEVNVFLIDVRKDLKNRQYHAYFPVYDITGRKPEKKEEHSTPAA